MLTANLSGPQHYAAMDPILLVGASERSLGVLDQPNRKEVDRSFQQNPVDLSSCHSNR